MLHIVGRRSAKGFTLIELVLVLGVMALVATIGYSGWSKYRYQTAARMAANQFMQDLRYAREQAQVRATTIRVTWSGNQYTIATKDGTTIKAANLMLYGPMMKITPPAGKISFDYRGTLVENIIYTDTTDVSFGTTETFSNVKVHKAGYAKVNKGKKK